MFFELLSIIAPVFVCAVIGYTWARSGRPFETEMVTNLITTFGVPTLVYVTLVKVEIDLAQLGEMAIATVLFLGISGAGAALALRAFGQPIRSFLPALIFPNTGNMGLPLALFAFGEAGLALGVAYFTVCIIFQFTLGVAVSTGSMNLKNLLRVPTLYATGLAIVMLLTETETPEWIMNTVELLGGMTIPIMLIALGVSLAKLSVHRIKTSMVISLGRLGGGFVVAYGIGTALGFEGIALSVLIMQSTMPVAVFNYLFAQRYNTHPEEVAGSVVISTVLSFATMPALLWFLL